MIILIFNIFDNHITLPFGINSIANDLTVKANLRCIPVNTNFRTRCQLAGRGVKKDERQGMHWITQSASQGYPQAAEALAKAYADGLYGLEQDLQQARYWYQRAGKKFQ